MHPSLSIATRLRIPFSATTFSVFRQEVTRNPRAARTRVQRRRAARSYVSSDGKRGGLTGGDDINAGDGKRPIDVDLIAWRCCNEYMPLMFDPNDSSFNRANALYLAHAADVAYCRAPAEQASERLGLKAVAF